MIGLLDLHLQIAIESNWAIFRDNYTAFSELVGEQNLVSAEQVAEWWTALRAHEFLTKQYSASGVDQLPICYLELTSTKEIRVPLGRRVFKAADHRWVDQIWTEQVVMVRLIMQSRDLARVMAQVVIACMHMAYDQLLLAGYLNVEYRDNDGPTPIPEYIAEQWGMTGVNHTPIRVTGQGWSNIKHWEQAPETIGDVQVLANDIIGIDGVRGGVVALEQV